MIFTIKKGKHYSNKWLYKLTHLLNFKQEQSYKIVFNESCLYNSNLKNKFDVNKLFGFSIGLNHKQSSLRFGWNVIDGKIKIYTYTYINGYRSIKEIFEVNINEEYTFTINKIYFSISSQFKSNIIGIDYTPFKTPSSLISYNLWPYFGGNSKSPQDIKIFFKKLY